MQVVSYHKNIWFSKSCDFSSNAMSCHAGRRYHWELVLLPRMEIRETREYHTVLRKDQFQLRPARHPARYRRSMYFATGRHFVTAATDESYIR
eukprot:4135426-Amphidinium_carterae.1